MALNIKPFEGPRAPDWTDPPVELAPAATSEGQEEKSNFENSDAHLLLLEPALIQGERYRLKKLDII